MSKVEFRLAILGDAGVGKTSLVHRMTKSHFNTHASPTVGASFFVHSVPFEDKIYEFQIWDTAGQEQYHSLASTYYRNAQGVLILFDLTNPNSFFTAQQWVAELLSMNRRYLILLIGNKLDLSFRSVSNETALSYAKNVGIGYIEVSAKTAQNIDNILVEIISSAKDMNFLASLRSPSILRLEETTEIIKKKKFCLFC